MSEQFWIRIGGKYKLLIDKSGFPIETPKEGAFGYVFKVFGTSDVGRGGSEEAVPYALKIPKLTADTMCENTLIASKLETEARIVEKHKNNKQIGNIEPPETNAFVDVEVCNTVFRDEQHEGGGIHSKLLVRFDKQKGPQFAKIFFCRAEGSFHVWDSSEERILKSTEDQQKTLSEEQRRALIEEERKRWQNAGPNILSVSDTGKDSLTRLLALLRVSDPDHTPQRRRQESLVLERPLNPSSQPSNVAPLKSFATLALEDSTWYADLPNLVAEWKDGSLQEARTKGHLADRPIDWRLEIARRLLTAVDRLHYYGDICGDLRLANIMFAGTIDKFTPGNCFLIDYGSFSDDFLGQDRVPSGFSAGPVLGNVRTSVFYAPERRAPIARETADTAVIYMFENDGAWPAEIKGAGLVRLDWSSNISKLDSAALKQDTIALMGQAVTPGSNGSLESPTKPSILWPAPKEDDFGPNDYLRIKDYAFRVVDRRWSPSTGQEIVLFDQVKRVKHDRVLIDEVFSDDTENGKALLAAYHAGIRHSIPQVLEFRGWSAATDIYSVGVMLLYLLFCRTPKMGKQQPQSTRKLDQNTESDEILLDAHFLEMIETLENPSFFATIWPELNKCYECLRHAFEDTNLSADKMPQHLIQGESLGELLDEFVCHLALNVPFLHHFVLCVDKNSAVVILTLHFALSCIHRQTSLKRGESPVDTNVAGTVKVTDLPFCRNRREEPRPGGPASEALKRFEQVITKIIVDKSISALVIQRTIPEYDSASELELSKILRHIALEGQRSNSQENEGRLNPVEQAQCVNDLIRRLHAQTSALQEQLQGSKREAESARRALRENAERNEELKGKNELLEEEARRIKDETLAMLKVIDLNVRTLDTLSKKINDALEVNLKSKLEEFKSDTRVTGTNLLEIARLTRTDIKTLQEQIGETQKNVLASSNRADSHDKKMEQKFTETIHAIEEKPEPKDFLAKKKSHEPRV